MKLALVLIIAAFAFGQDVLILKHKAPAAGGGGTVATPTDSPGAGTYSTTQTVTLSDATGSSTICYTIDGSTPGASTPGTCNSSPTTTYTTGISVAATTTVKAIGTKAAMTNSGVLSSLYTISAGVSLGVNFRATSGYVTDSGGNTYSLGEAYPTTRGGLTFGWNADSSGSSRDRNSGNDSRLAGMNYGSTSVTGSCASLTTPWFKIDLPNGAGTYKVELASGDPSNAFTESILICDGSTAVATFNGVSTGANSFMDSAGSVHTAANWPANEAKTSMVFAGTSITIMVGYNTANTGLTHVHISQP